VLYTSLTFPNPFALLWRQFKIELRLYLRDRAAMFWTFIERDLPFSTSCSPA
jgi:hypothetical protein